MSWSRENSVGIFEWLQQCRIYLPGSAALMNVSGVRFDKSCNRMGRGRGRYDKYYGKYGQECVFRVELTTEDRVEEERSVITG